ncbi:MAG: thioesterase family protein [Gemmatimonadales bacterium]
MTTPGGSAIPLGATATTSVVVTRDLTVAHFHPGLPEAYGTPMMVYLMEVAAGEAIQPYLPAGWASVGVAVSVKHLAATPVGRMVTASATVTAVDEKTVTFAVTAHDGTEPIGAGTHVRAPIDLHRFNMRLAAKARGP